ncbi:hypothetical protein EVAR_21078_1 [Eumeta japonica]|uniref:Uncharacterized protein n=1 Tax=Eumeta variegata TaxID=151549 RepID=A0A4C1V1T2_EUMVA|nr:hypothetical protein EVAR_21078_1 [Eumeta japonica]
MDSLRAHKYEQARGKSIMAPEIECVFPRKHTGVSAMRENAFSGDLGKQFWNKTKTYMKYSPAVAMARHCSKARPARRAGAGRAGRARGLKPTTQRTG